MVMSGFEGKQRRPDGEDTPEITPKGNLFKLPTKNILNSGIGELF